MSILKELINAGDIETSINNLDYRYLSNYDRWLIDDTTDFGTKQRIARVLVDEAVKKGYKYLAYKARYGLASSALAAECAKYNGKIKLVMFCSAVISGMYRDIFYPYKRWPKIVHIRFYKNYGSGNLECRMREWCKLHNGLALKGGFSEYHHNEEILGGLGKDIVSLSGNKRLFMVSASNTLYQNFAKVFPETKPITVVQVDRNEISSEYIRSCDTYIKDYLDFYEDAKMIPPYDCALNYDAKAFRFCIERGEPGDCIFNVGKSLEDLRDNESFYTYLTNEERKCCIVHKEGKCYIEKENWLSE